MLKDFVHSCGRFLSLESISFIVLVPKRAKWATKIEKSTCNKGFRPRSLGRARCTSARSVAVGAHFLSSTFRDFVTLTSLVLGLVSCSIYNPERLKSEIEPVNANEVDDAGNNFDVRDDGDQGGVEALGENDTEFELCRPNPEDNPSCPEICPEVCDGKDNDCDSETDEEEAHGDCSLSHAVAHCRNGDCLIYRCHEGFDDCDGNQNNGCETPVDTILRCGSCDNSCGDLKSTKTVRCIDGKCKASECQLGFSDCDGDPDNGCETRLDSMSNCGGCSKKCELSTCEGGVCSSLECPDGFSDCDGDKETGCETPLTSLTDCVVCGRTCSYPNATASCETGDCIFVDCQSGYSDCNDDLSDGCETDITAMSNCGACGNECDDGESCIGGTCTGEECEQGMGDCDGNPENGCETPLNSLEHCGLCDQPCNSTIGQQVSCETGTCEIQSCQEGYHDCDQDPANGCESRLRDDLNCGACNQLCQLEHATASCASGECELVGCESSDFENCNTIPDDGCEVELGTSQNCGGCNDVCAEGDRCLDGQCQPGCDLSACPSDCILGMIPCCRLDNTCSCHWPLTLCL